MNISDILPGWTAVSLWSSKTQTFTSSALAFARIKLGRESTDCGAGPRSPEKSRNTYRAPNGKYYKVTMYEIRVSDDALRADIAEITRALGDAS